MKRSINTKLILALLMVSVMAATVAYAAIVYRYPITGNMVVTDDELTVYEVDGETLIVSIDFGNISPGDTATHDIIVENTGDFDVQIGMEHNLAPMYGNLTFDAVPGPLVPGGTEAHTLTLVLETDCPKGSLSLTIEITASRTL